MEQFVVPQFIDVEDKIIGPITVRQFVILLVGGVICFVAYKLSDFALFIIELVVIMAITFGFAFIKVNGRPLHYLFLNIFQTARRPKLRVWQKIVSATDMGKKGKVKKELAPVVIPVKGHVRSSRLAELSLVVDTGGVYQGEGQPSDSNL